MKYIFFSVLLVSLSVLLSCESIEKTELDNILATTSQPGEIIHEGDIQALPFLIQQHLKVAGVIGTPRHFNVYLYGTGGLKQEEDGEWNPLTNTFYLTYRPISRFWYGEIITSLGKMSGFDYYHDGNGRLSIRYEPSVSFQEANDDKTTISELITFLSEHIYNPSGFLNPYLTWGTTTDSTVTVIISDAGLKTTGTFCFDRDGLIEKFISTERFKGSGSEAKQKTWEVTLGAYGIFEGISIPTTFKACWLSDSTSFEYIHGTITDVRFDVSEAQ